MKKHIPLIIAVVIVGGIILTLLIGYIVGKLQKDYDGFAEDLTKVLEHNNCSFIESNGDYIYKIYVEDARWNNMDNDQKFNFCQGMLDSVRNLAWKHKIMESPNSPTLKLYNAAGNVADIDGDYIHLYK